MAKPTKVSREVTLGFLILAVQATEHKDKKNALQAWLLFVENYNRLTGEESEGILKENAADINKVLAFIKGKNPVIDATELFKKGSGRLAKQFFKTVRSLKWGDKFETTAQDFQKFIGVLYDNDISFRVTRITDHKHPKELDALWIEIFAGEDDSSVGAVPWMLGELTIYQDGTSVYKVGKDLNKYVKEQAKKDFDHAHLISQGLGATFVSLFGKRKNPFKERIKGGRAKGKKPSDFDAKALEKGTEVEMEHTDDRDIAREIAMDHLAEDPDYYEMLALVHNPSAMVKGKRQEKLWKEAKKKVSQARGYPEKEFDDTDWGLVTHIFKKLMEK